jgi:serine/threonine-protein kinase
VKEGVILSQNPPPKTSAKQGSTVSVVVSSGLPMEQIPNLSVAPANSSCTAATNALVADHLKPSCTQQSSITVAAGQVISWTPKGKVRYGTTVNVVTSSGAPTVTIPTNLTGTGTTCQTATAALQAVHLQPSCQNEYSTTVPTVGQVIGTNPTASALYNSTVIVEISEGPPLVTVPTMSSSTSVQQSITDLENVGFQVGTIYGPGGGKVFATNPAEGSSAPEGSTINLYTH